MSEFRFKLNALPAGHPMDKATGRKWNYNSPGRTRFEVVRANGDRDVVNCNARDAVELAVGDSIVVPAEWDDTDKFPQEFKVLLDNKFAEVVEV